MLDYIFYRAYIAYEKKKDPGHFGATAYCTVICMFLFMPIFCLPDFFIEQQPYRKVAVILYILLITVGVFFRYYRKNRVKMIIVRYRGSIYNKRIATWLFFLILPLSMIIGVGAYALISKALKYSIL